MLNVNNKMIINIMQDVFLCFLLKKLKTPRSTIIITNENKDKDMAMR